MLKSPENLGIIHFIGIGGIGMSGIAEILHQSGYLIQGSDRNKNNNTKRLEKLGIKIYIGQKKSNIKNAKIIVVSTAISDTNEEFVAAKKMYLPMQMGDVPATYSDSSKLYNWIQFKPNTSVEYGVAKFIEWYKDYYELNK